MSKKKTVESSLGVHVPEAVAFHIDEVLKTLPKDKRYEYRRKGAVASAVEVVADEPRTEISKITTSVMDRDFEIVLPEGIDLTQYRLNPIVLLGHDQDKPIGKAAWIKPEGESITAKTVYTKRPKDYATDWLPDYAWAMVQADVLRGKSIGFLPLEILDPTPEQLAVNPALQSVITRSLLLEYSVVAVPSNPLALVDAIGKGLGMPDWTIEFTGRSIHKKKPVAKKPDYSKYADEVDAIKLDPERIAELALKSLLEKWDV